jgi:hypothetical protein
MMPVAKRGTNIWPVFILDGGVKDSGATVVLEVAASICLSSGLGWQGVTTSLSVGGMGRSDTIAASFVQLCLESVADGTLTALGLSVADGTSTALGLSVVDGILTDLGWSRGEARCRTPYPAASSVLSVHTIQPTHPSHPLQP